MRIRIALATATAVIALPAVFFAFFSSTSAASPRVIRHEASSRPDGEDHDKLMSYSQAEYVAELVNYSNAVGGRPTPSSDKRRPTSPRLPT